MKRLNKSHPDCAIYAARFKKIWDAYFEFEAAERAKYPDWRGLDHPSDLVTRPAHRKCCEATRQLQEEYSYLFSDIEQAGE